MKFPLTMLAAMSCPLFVAGVFVSIRSHWGPTEGQGAVGRYVYHLTADEAGLYLARFPKLYPGPVPQVPRTYDWEPRVRFSSVRATSGSAVATLVHVPYWPFWMIVTPPLIGWLVRESHRRLAMTRIAQKLCVGCGYDLRATPMMCPECGRPTA